ncbi:BTB-domain-containing protein [Gigaspora margarita]|uniref:BTB-domain-containing protein n=1 Tax=Gigaspora margarita TaxID=4874 RepID=A0A8H4ALE7_GIGMA|nr:BTB-domain-containing protein [Gigaspora margarita]
MIEVPLPFASLKFRLCCCYSNWGRTNFKEINTHSTVLRARSPYFKVAFSNKWVKRYSSVTIFKKPNITPAEFLMILRSLIKSHPGYKRISFSLCTQSSNSKVGFLTLDKDILLSLIKRDDLGIEEIVIWKYLGNLKRWTDNDFALLKKSLDPFIPYIRFHEISNEEFYYHDKHKNSIPENLYEDLVAYLMANVIPKVSMLPPRYGSISIDSM